MDTSDFINKVDFDSIDNIIALLRCKKKKAAAENTFKTIFEKGYLIELQYDDDRIVYVDRLLETKVAGNTIWYTFGIFGTNGELSASVILKNKDFFFSKNRPYDKVVGQGNLFFNENKDEPHDTKAFVVCQLVRGVYDKKCDTTLIGQQTMDRLASIGKKLGKMKVNFPALKVDFPVPSFETVDEKVDETVNEKESVKGVAALDSKQESVKDVAASDSNGIASKGIALERVTKAIQEWLFNYEIADFCHRQIKAEISINEKSNKDSITYTKNSNLCLSFGSMFVDANAKKIVFGFKCAKSIDDVNDERCLKRANGIDQISDERYIFSWKNCDEFSVSYNKEAGKMTIIGKEGDAKTWQIELRLFDGKCRYANADLENMYLKAYLNTEK